VKKKTINTCHHTAELYVGNLKTCDEYIKFLRRTTNYEEEII